MKADKEMEVLRGEPVKLMIGGQEETVLRLSVDEQLEVMDIFVASLSDGGDNKSRAATMIKVLSKCCRRELKTGDFSSAAALMEAFAKVWAQNEFDFLLQQVVKLKQSLTTS